MRLANRRILVTGAASGIGEAVCAMFRAEGALVAMLDRDQPKLREAAGRIGTGAFPFVADVSDEVAVQRAVEAAVQALGGLDGVVNSAGIDLLRPFAEMSAADWRRIMAVDLDGPFLVCRAALPALRASGTASIVNIASAAGLRPLEHRTAYCSAKAALVMFSKALAVDLAADNIRVNVICPGIIETPLFRSSFESEADPATALRTITCEFRRKPPTYSDLMAPGVLI